MFKHLTNFGYTRTANQAIGFYVAYLLLTIVAAGLLAGTLGVLTGNDSFQFGARIGAFTAIVVSVLLCFVILKQKHLLNNFGYILLALIAGVVAFFAGGLGGLIPAAYLTTRKATK